MIGFYDCVEEEIMMRHVIKGTFALALITGIAACGGTAPAPGETAAKPAVAAGEATVRADLIEDWQDQKDMMMKIADAMPEDKFGYKSTPAQRSYGEQIMHVATVNVDLLKVVGGTATPPSFTADSAKTKADILKALAESYDYGIALLNDQTDAGMTEAINAAFLGPSTRGRMFWFLLGHSMDVYGQMVVYLRLNGIVPPASRA
jgi:uncharacterized damage-inducible protein DinB